MGRYLLLWLLGVPIPILVLIWAFGGLDLIGTPHPITLQKGAHLGGRLFAVCIQ